MSRQELVGPSLCQGLAAFVSLAEKTARAKLIYRLSTLISFMASGLGYAVFLLVWLEVYRAGGPQAGVEKDAMVSYLTLGFILNATLTLFVESRFFLRLRQGLITADLLRPLGFMAQQLAQALGDVAVNALLSLPLFAVAVLFLGARVLPESPLSFVLGLVSALLALLIQFAIGYLLVQASFVLHSGYGIVTTRAALHQVLSGLSAPLAMFPEPLRQVAILAPFRHVIETPVLLWLGQVPAGAVTSLLLSQLAWAAALLGLGASIFSAALARHQIQGG